VGTVNPGVLTLRSLRTGGSLLSGENVLDEQL